jgi:AraC-like DNA-binding protein
MSSIRQTSPDPAWGDPGVVASYQLHPGTGFDAHRHEAHQLCLAAEGVLAMAVRERGWILPRSRGLWIPAGVPHSVGTIGATSMTALWFDPERCPVRWASPTVFEVDALLGQLVDRLVRENLPPAERRRSEAVVFDLLQPLPEAVLVDLPMPADDRARQVAEGLVADPTDGRSLQGWGRAVGASDRTLLRAFQAETGVGFHEWRTRARVAAALPQLADGVPVRVVAGNVGFGSPSAFTAAFKRTLGSTPSAYLAR